MKIKLIPVFIVLAFCCQGILSSAQNPIIAGNARFTIIRPEVIRMEYATDGKFVDAPTLFATNRSDFTNDFKLNINDDVYTITTNRMQLVYKNDGLPFSQM